MTGMLPHFFTGNGHMPSWQPGLGEGGVGGAGEGDGEGEGEGDGDGDGDGDGEGDGVGVAAFVIADVPGVEFPCFRSAL